MEMVNAAPNGDASGPNGQIKPKIRFLKPAVMLTRFTFSSQYSSFLVSVPFLTISFRTRVSPNATM